MAIDSVMVSVVALVAALLTGSETRSTMLLVPLSSCGAQSSRFCRYLVVRTRACRSMKNSILRQDICRIAFRHGTFGKQVFHNHRRRNGHHSRAVYRTRITSPPQGGCHVASPRESHHNQEQSFRLDYAGCILDSLALCGQWASHVRLLLL